VGGDSKTNLHHHTKYKKNCGLLDLQLFNFLVEAGKSTTPSYRNVLYIVNERKALGVIFHKYRAVMIPD
jgi:hypothetical protein